MTVGGADPSSELIGLLLQERSNRRRIYASLAAVLAALTAILLDIFWFPWATAGDRMLPSLGLVVVCIGCLWLADKLSRENQRLAERISVLAEGMEWMALKELTRGQQEALDAQLRLNIRLAYALVVVGVAGGLSLAVALLVSVEWVLLKTKEERETATRTSPPSGSKLSSIRCHRTKLPRLGEHRGSRVVGGGAGAYGPGLA